MVHWFNTLRQVDEFVALRGEEDLVVAYSDARRRYYRKLRTFDTFGRGWLRRVDETEVEALRLAGYICKTKVRLYNVYT